MPNRKQRLTVTVDPELVHAGNRAVAAGEADSLSGWVSTAMSEKAQRDEKLAGLRAAIADYETEFGEITTGELAAQRRADRAEAVVVRGPLSRRGQPRRASKAKPA
jgi:glycerol dehydrogenase-like iron-containing ADH family enzyme